MAGQPIPPGPRTTRPETRPYQELINHRFPLVKPVIKPLFLRGVR